MPGAALRYLCLCGTRLASTLPFALHGDRNRHNRPQALLDKDEKDRKNDDNKAEGEQVDCG